MNSFRKSVKVLCATHNENTQVFYSLCQRRNSQDTGFTWKLHPWLAFPIAPQNMPFAKGYCSGKGSHLYWAQQPPVSAIPGRHYGCPACQGLQTDGRKGRGKWYQLLGGDQQQFLAPGCSDSASLIIGHFKAAETKACMICMSSLKNLSLEIFFFFLFYQFHARELHWHQEHCIRFKAVLTGRERWLLHMALVLCFFSPL